MNLCKFALSVESGYDGLLELAEKKTGWVVLARQEPRFLYAPTSQINERNQVKGYALRPFPERWYQEGKC